MIEAAEVFKINPKFSLDNFAKTLPPARDQLKRDAFIYALRKSRVARQTAATLYPTSPLLLFCHLTT